MNNQKYKNYQFRIGDKYTEAAIVAFDKDGVLTDSKALLLELNRQRMILMQDYADNDFISKWMHFIGVIADFDDNGNPSSKDIITGGSAYTASTSEDTIISGAYFMEHLEMEWTDAYRLAQKIHNTADENIDIAAIAKPRLGFPRIFERLRDAGIPYGIITLDVKDRVEKMIDYLDDKSKLSYLISPEDVKICKPAPDAILKVADMYNIEPSQIITIGDMCEDLMMAKAAGAYAVGYPESDATRSKLEPYADAIIDSLDDIDIVG